jgi:hypothetical protein
MQKVEGSSPFIRFEERPVNRPVSVSVQCPGLGEQGHWVAAVMGGDGVGQVGMQRALL